MMITLELIVTALATLIAWVARACSALGSVREALAQAHEYITGMMAVTEAVTLHAK
jgi:hypothetical protein